MFKKLLFYIRSWEEIGVLQKYDEINIIIPNWIQKKLNNFYDSFDINSKIYGRYLHLKGQFKYYEGKYYVYKIFYFMNQGNYLGSKVWRKKKYNKIKQ